MKTKRKLYFTGMSGTNHDSGDVFGVISIQVELERHHLVIVCLQLALHHPVNFIRELQRQEC